MITWPERLIIPSTEWIVMPGGVPYCEAFDLTPWHHPRVFDDRPFGVNMA
jgi:hypothetical protein